MKDLFRRWASADEVFCRVHPRVPALLGAPRNIVPAGEKEGEEFAPAVTQLLMLRVSSGTMDTILCHPREVFRLAVMASAAAIIIAHPSGEPTPSEADIKITRDLIRAGQLLKIEVLDHIILGHSTQTSLRTLGYFYS